jgi:hypothetical protein
MPIFNGFELFELFVEPNQVFSSFWEEANHSFALSLNSLLIFNNLSQFLLFDSSHAL